MAVSAPSLPCIAVIACCLVGTASAEPAAVLGDFADASQWQAIASDGETIDFSTEPATDDDPSPALRLDIDFKSGAGFVGIRRELSLDLPANFELAFRIRGDLPPNNLEVKLVDPSEQNVWWVNRRAFEFPREWTQLASRRRHFQFAWGPSNAPIRHVGAIEIIVASANGGRGTIWLDGFAFRPLPETRPYGGKPTITASSQAATASLSFAADSDFRTVWRSAAGDQAPELTIDFGEAREFGGMVLDWDAAAPAAGSEVQYSDDGKDWRTVRTVGAGGGRTQYLALPDSEARLVRLRMTPPSDESTVAVREIEVLPLEAARDANAFAAVVAGRAPRGHYPRAIGGDGTFWTIVGVPDDEHEALVSEDGAVEVDKREFSIEPFLYVDDRLLTWADGSTAQSLAAGHAPVPTVTRTHDGLTLSVTAAADGQPGASSLMLLYTVTNTSSKPVDGRLLLAIRPIQVNPPYQWLNTIGGVTQIDRIALADSRRAIEVDGRRVYLGEPPDAFGAATCDAGDITTYLSHGEVPRQVGVADPHRAASAAAAYQFQLDPDESRSWVLAVPFPTGKNALPAADSALLSADDPVDYVRRRQQAVTDEWVRATSTFDLLLPAEAADVANTIRSTLAYIMINRDGPAIQPGSRSYERSWIRDGSLTAAALLRFGLEERAREFVDWYALHQFDNGKVPCVVDRRGPDPVPENDSHGQYIMAVMNVYRFTGDQEFLRAHWPRVQKAVAYMEQLRAQRMTPEYADPATKSTKQEPDKPAVSLHAFCGLMPESISHEGYSAKPMHSYWDDFFALRGLKDAAEMAHVLGEQPEAERYQVLADDFARTLYASIDQAMQTHQIDYIPGCVELGDFDATSTTVALWPCGELARLPRPALDRTFDRYWERFVQRRDDPSFAWVDYTPYEVRCIGSLVLLGQVDRAHEAMEFFLADRRPTAWNQWPEVVHRKPRTPRFVGDLPHTWCGSDFLNSVRMLFLWEDEADDALVLLPGVPASWVSVEPVGFNNMPTYGGRVTCTVVRPENDGGRLVAQISGTCPVPSGGIRLASPLGPPTRAAVNGQPAEMDGEGRVVVKAMPAEVELEFAAAAP